METKPLHLYSNLHFLHTTHFSPSKNHFFNTTTPKRPKLYTPKTTTTIHSTYKNGGGIQCPVPLDQQPIIEYQNISTSFPFSWACSNLVEFSSRLFVIGLSFSLLLGLPVSFFGSVGHHPDPFKLVIGSASTGLFVVILIVLRMYLGWAYVGNRLFSATVEYEETGWYDGQIWVKTAEVLARDRLLGSFQVKPVLNKLKNSLVALGIALFICVALFINYEGSQEESVSSFNGPKGGAVAGVYDDESARLFEPDAFCGGSGLVAE